MSTPPTRITRQQAAAVAALARTVRPAWDELAIRNVIGRQLVDRDLADVAAAAVRAARNPECRTPAGIAFDGPHWHPAARTSGPSVNETCKVPGHEGYYAANCAGCRADRLTTATPTDPIPSRYHPEENR